MTTDDVVVGFLILNAVFAVFVVVCFVCVAVKNFVAASGTNFGAKSLRITAKRSSEDHQR